MAHFGSIGTICYPVAGFEGTTVSDAQISKLTVRGDAYERGRQHGVQTRALVHEGVDFYTRMWTDNVGGDKEDVLALAGGFESVIGDYDAQILAELEGIAAGAEMTLREILLLNARYELMLEAVFTQTPPAAPGECTSLAAAPEATADGHTLIAQNWDWSPEVGPRSVLMEIQQENRPDILTHMEAGFAAHKGLNSAGLGLCVNAMCSQHDRFRSAVPVWVLARAILNCSTIDEAEAAVARAQRAASVNFTVASRCGEVASLEVSPTDVSRVPPTAGRIAHGNVFVDLSEDRGLEDRLAVLYPEFCDRARRAGELIAADDVSVDRLKTILRDHANRPESICRHREDQPGPLILETLSSVIMDLDAETLHMAVGPPCSSSYTEHTLSRSRGATH